jgi:hypothetical protein
VNKLSIDAKAEIQQRLDAGQSLRSVARILGVTYQALQYRREMWDMPKLRAETRRGANHPNWRGGISIDRWGYRLVYAPERTKGHPYSYEHVLVAEETIGRRLKKNEHVHHLNGQKLDNRPENLLVCTQSEHRSLHRQLERLAIELVQRGDIVYRDGKYQWAK